MKIRIVFFLLFAFFAGNVFSQSDLKKFVVSADKNPEQQLIYEDYGCTSDDGVLVFHTTIPDLSFTMPDNPGRLKNVSAFDKINKCYVLCVQPTDKNLGGTFTYHIYINGDKFKPEIWDVTNINAVEAQYFRIDPNIAKITVRRADGEPLSGANIKVDMKDKSASSVLHTDANGVCEITIPDGKSPNLIITHHEYIGIITIENAKSGDVEERQFKTRKPPEVNTKKFYFGLVGGLSIANQLSDSWLYEEDKTPQLGFAGGLLLEYKLTKWLSFQPELQFVMKGVAGKAHTSDRYIDNGTGNYLSDVQVKDTMRINYLELPLNLVFNIPLKEDNIYLVVGGGYYFAYGVYGKLKFGPSKESYSFDKDTEEVFSGDTKILNPFDQGINCLLGLRFKPGVDDSGLFIRAGYSYSLNNMATGKGEGFASFKNNCFTVSLGYYF